ncbi:YceI family protein [Mucilaginibacter pallidiroseus]|nr:YceI family protein [Mucilaginibacter pallidiroseus]
MKTSTYTSQIRPAIILLSLIFSFLIPGCKDPVKKVEDTKAPTSSLKLHTGDHKYYMADAKLSVLQWKGASLNGLNTQTGYIYLSKGELKVESGRLTGGVLEIDMNTIEDKYHGANSKLVNHLKDPDFFEVKKFPFAKIYITSVTPAKIGLKTINGDLTIKGISHPVSIPAQVEIADSAITANAKFTIDRTLWNVRYKSAKFYELLANQTMSDSISFQIKVVAKKQR